MVSVQPQEQNAPNSGLESWDVSRAALARVSLTSTLTLALGQRLYNNEQSWGM
jgi:hypothetical protein